MLTILPNLRHTAAQAQIVVEDLGGNIVEDKTQRNVVKAQEATVQLRHAVKSVKSVKC